jgi:glc operon protein GlcG
MWYLSGCFGGLRLRTVAGSTNDHWEDTMRQAVSIASALGVALLLGSQAVAQQPPPNPPAGGTPEAMPFDIPYGLGITTDKAKQILSAAEAEAKKRNWKMNIAVVDTNGDLIHFLRMDGAQVASVAISQGKARTAARYRRPTQVFYNAYETGHPYVATLDPTLVASPGGFPLIEGGKLIGAIGCSGGTGDQDALICKVGADMIK